MNDIHRRRFLQGALAGLCLPVGGLIQAQEPLPAPALLERVRGMMYGTAVGDALGGPIEFQSREAVSNLPDPPKRWQPGEAMDAAARIAARERVKLRPYDPLRPAPESYGQWNVHSLAGTITDDTRHKLVLLHALHRAATVNRWPLTSHHFAEAYLEWPLSRAVADRPGYPALAADWLEEYGLAARWVTGERDPKKARPTERLWNGWPTCWGQMALLPLAAVFAGHPSDAYLASYRLGFADVGWAKDMNSALVAGLAAALTLPFDAQFPDRAWKAVIQTVLQTDPFRYGQIRWTIRSVQRWMDVATRLVQKSAGRPAALISGLEEEFKTTTKWEAQVPFVVCFACLQMADYDPLAAIQLSFEWGHDTDSFAQLIGAFGGALHGPALFPLAWRELVLNRLKADHGVDWEDECRFLNQLRTLGVQPGLVSE